MRVLVVAAVMFAACLVEVPSRAHATEERPGSAAARDAATAMMGRIPAYAARSRVIHLAKVCGLRSEAWSSAAERLQSEAMATDALGSSPGNDMLVIQSVTFGSGVLNGASAAAEAEHRAYGAAACASAGQSPLLTTLDGMVPVR